ncbi:MAG: MBL fold metallo-hydrolase [candidate division Zixibacteria bacterium]|nr:MBL fold metallo-hydrolase [candidate division Zixibacteria bacterium]
MKLKFIGTRGNIEAKNRRHRRHSSLLVSYNNQNLMIDCGKDWRGNFQKYSPQAILLTHAHPDHAFGLKDGAPCPVYATSTSWKKLDDLEIDDKRKLSTDKKHTVKGIEVKACTVEHSLKAPAVGFRMKAGRHQIFYAPDLVYIHERSRALKGVDVYIGDGATIDRSFVRKRGDYLIGHAPVRTQLTWCQKENVDFALITHCGSQIVESDERKLGAKLRRMAGERGVSVKIAYDGMETVLS